ncbi:MAG: DUF6174 domain-containing protein [Treponema sp.]|jgi:hypothetical protein|nr:DUF6174 domain-containing protein [Treponema sp.]
MKQALNGLLIVVSLMAIVSCDALFLTNVTVDFDYQKFNEEKALWNTLKPNNYQYNLEHWNDGFSMPVDTVIIVENGKYKTQIPHQGSDYDYESQFYLTITDVYESIEREYKEYHNTKQSKADAYLKKIEIKYDAGNHIPVEIKQYYYVSPILADAASYGETKITGYRVNN